MKETKETKWHRRQIMTRNQHTISLRAHKGMNEIYLNLPETNLIENQVHWGTLSR
jgi:hypothetical protein